METYTIFTNITIFVSFLLLEMLVQKMADCDSSKIEMYEF